MSLSEQAVQIKLLSHDCRIEYDGSGNLIYLGKNLTHDAATSNALWEIWKFTYSSGNLVRWERLTGAWDNRATLDWG